MGEHGEGMWEVVRRRSEDPKSAVRKSAVQVLHARLHALLLAAAPYLGLWLKSAEITFYLRIFALDIPLFALANSVAAVQSEFQRRKLSLLAELPGNNLINGNAGMAFSPGMDSG